ncbi:MAG: DUF4386 domain-containing protein [Sphingobacteriales bacterium]|nr:DUF4386 domain-containing protein [Sphingobacteriales bacterium]
MEKKYVSPKRIARLAGLLYLLWIITGLYGLMYVPSQTIVKGDTVATANKILANEFLFRSGIINDLISITIGIFLIMALYRLLKQVNEYQAKFMFALLFVTFPVVFIMDAFNIASLMILKGEVLKTFDLSQRQEVAMFLFKINNYGSVTLELFWGLWLIPFGQLVYKSGFIPRILGVFLVVNGITYIIHCCASLLFPDYQNIVRQMATPFWVLGEVVITLWLLIWGVKGSKGKEIASKISAVRL